MTNERSMSAPIVISSQGLAERDQRALKLVIEFVISRGVSCRYIGDGNSSGHIVVVDLETGAGHEALKKLRPGQVKILFSEEPIVGKNIVALITPIKFDVLKYVVIKICAQIQVQLNRRLKERVGVEPTTKETLSEQKKPPNDGPNIFNILFEIKKTKACVKVSVGDMPAVFVDGSEGVLATEAGIEKLQQILSSSSREIKTKNILSADIPSALISAISVSPLENALWLSGLSWCSGELLDNYTVDDTVKLKAWPNFTRNNFSPDHLKLSAALSAQAMSLRNLNALTQIPLSEIIRFFNSCYAVDLVDMNVKNENEREIVVEKNKINNKRRNLLFRLADRLGFS